MKYLIVIPDGCADEQQAILGGQTPLEAARTPHMDRLARQGLVGRASHVPSHLPAGSDVANLSLLGYDPCTYFTGRAPLEAAAQGITLGANDWAIRCNLVTLQQHRMRDFTAGHISSAEASELLSSLQIDFGSPSLRFVPGVSYRNLLIFHSSELAPFSRDTTATPPHDLTDRVVSAPAPKKPKDLFNDWMQRSEAVFLGHDVNVKRIQRGELPATHIWLWGAGGAPSLPLFFDLHRLRGAMITAVDLLRGLAALVGWDRIEVPGATGYTDTDYAAKGAYAARAIAEYDVVCVHIEAPDEASHEGDVDAKITALEAIDREIVGPVEEALRSLGPYRVLVSPDHPTPVRTKTHSHGAVPFLIAGTGIPADDALHYDEPSANRSRLAFGDGYKLMEFFLRHPFET